MKSMNSENLSFLLVSISLSIMAYSFLLTCPRLAAMWPYTGYFDFGVAPCSTISCSFCLYFAMLFWAFVMFSWRFIYSFDILLFGLKDGLTCFMLMVSGLGCAFLPFDCLWATGFLNKLFLFSKIGMDSTGVSLFNLMGEWLFSITRRGDDSICCW